MEFFATAAKGTEPLLRDELRELRLPGVRADRGGVHFTGDWSAGFRACLWSRIALRVLTPIAHFDAPDGDALYDGIRTFDWSEVLTPRHTVAVGVALRDGALTHSQFVAQRTKDAIVDQLRDRHGTRPDVDKRDPDCRVFVHLVRDAATAYLDLSGESLHLRGWRNEAGIAPLKETLAAALLRYSGWDRVSPLVDPLCGSGTLAIEAAEWAAGRAPGARRALFGFERWACHGEAERAAIRELREAAATVAQPAPLHVAGFDADGGMVAVARKNARAAGVDVRFDQRALHDLSPHGAAGALVGNPPYGARLQRDAGFDADLDDVIDRFAGWQRALIVPQGEPSRRRADRWLAVFNGDIACELRVWGK